MPYKNYKTLPDIFYFSRDEYKNDLGIYDKPNKSKEFVKTSFPDVVEIAENAAIGLMNLGVKAGSKVGLMADNRLEWLIADMATQLNGAIDVPRGSDSTSDEIKYILTHSEAEFVFIEHDKLYDKIKDIIPESIQKIIILDPPSKLNSENIIILKDLISDGKKNRKEKINELNRRSKLIKADDLATIIYTSGTTGNPKGVMLSHYNIVYNVETVPDMVGLKPGDRGLSILPVWHIFERTVEYALIASGCSMYYTNIRNLSGDFKSVQPTFMASAPRLWESIYAGIKAKVEKEEPLKKKIFDFSFEVNRMFHAGIDYLQGNKLQQKAENPFDAMIKTGWSMFTSVNLFVPSQVLNNTIFKKIRDALGGKLRGTLSGGGALPSHVDEFFNTIGIPLYEGYGMTETAPIIAARTVGHVIQGSVGFAPNGTQLKILDDKGKELPLGELGVVHVKGPQVMKGYYKNPEETKKVLVDGWMNTGDLGFISQNGTLSLRGRAKDTIVLLGGENIEPVPIENLLVEDKFIDQVMVIGQDKKTLGALIWPSFERLKDAGYNLSETDDLHMNQEMLKLFSSTIKKIISKENGFKSFERITGFRFLPKALEVGDELTNLFKMKRNVINQKYDHLIKEIYE